MSCATPILPSGPLGHVPEMTGHVAEIVGHNPETAGHVRPKYAQYLAQGQLPDLQVLRSRFAPDPASVPQVHVQLASLSDYEALLSFDMEAAA